MSVPHEAASAVYVVGVVKMIYVTNTFARQASPEEGQVYELIWRSADPDRWPAGLSLSDTESNQHHGWVRSTYLDDLKDRLRPYMNHFYVVRCRVTRIASEFAMGRERANQVEGFCWVDSI